MIANNLKPENLVIPYELAEKEDEEQLLPETKTINQDTSNSSIQRRTSLGLTK